MRVRETGYISGNSVHHYLYLRQILKCIPATQTPDGTYALILRHFLVPGVDTKR